MALTAAALFGLALVSAPAGAAPNAATLAAANSKSTFFAGYTVGAAGGPIVTSATTAFTVPAVVCPAGAPDTGVFPMVDVALNSRSFAQGGVVVQCESGNLRLEELAVINNFMSADGGFFPAAKDRITVFVTQTANGAEVLIKDLTQHKTDDFRGPVGAPTGGTDNTSAIGDEAITQGGIQVGNPPFGTIVFSQDQTNGIALGAQPHTAFNEVTAGGTMQIVTSPVNASGISFNTRFRHA